MLNFHGKRSAVSSTRTHKKTRADSPNYKASPPRNRAAGDKMGDETPTGWIDFNDDLHIYQPAVPLQGSAKVAGFDLDGTLIKTRSGKVFATDASDWQFLYPEVPNKLKSLHQKEGYKVVIFTNQAGMSKGKTKVSEWRQKVDSFLAKVGIPIQIFCASGGGQYRKPAPGMWDFFVQNYNEGVAVDMENSVYVGDAAGRPNSGGKGKKDFAATDRLFALNAKLPFKTPEEYFLDKKPEKYELTAFDARRYLEEARAGKVTLVSPPTAALFSQAQELVLLVGPPGIGKSHFVKQHLLPKEYVHINRDTLRTWQKCVAEADKQLAAGKSVVIDNTNPDKESRNRYIQLATKHGVACRCFVFVTSIEHAKHNNKFRELIDPEHDHVPEMVFHAWKNKYEAPVKEEGFSEVVEVNFVPSFTEKKHEELYSMFLLEK
ncbi:hypothetical protein RvY_19109 [Ramazzottius varieornatus]|uniref:PNK FHA domain-containing protein n=1 Tax=Ramazzottius varieornatus TaxID=947166 RepID=A0A1D1W9M1_RAMVA|nr:hypothetical protein RvY_19109 [Ramazzottius varieornatus]